MIKLRPMVGCMGYGMRGCWRAPFLARARNRYGYEGADIYRLAADYGYGIARNHPFIDGNKRTAFQVMYVFLKVNSWELDAPEPEVVLVMRSLAAGELSEDELAQWLRQYSSKEA